MNILIKTQKSSKLAICYKFLNFKLKKLNLTLKSSKIIDKTQILSFDSNSKLFSILSLMSKLELELDSTRKFKLKTRIGLVKIDRLTETIT